MDIPIAMDTWGGKGDQLKLSQHQQLIPRLILTCCMVATMVSGIMAMLDTMDIPIAMDTWGGKGDQLKLSQHQQLIPRLILTCCMVATMVLGIMAMLYYGYPYSYGYLGRKRRSAEADPTPAADPKADPYYLLRGYYGHGYYGYPHYGY